MIKIEQRDYPFVEGHFGIPFSRINFWGDTQITSGSGQKLKCQFYPDFIRIADYSSNSELFAKVRNGQMSAALRTKLPEGLGKHRDMFAGRFLEFALGHFQKNGIEVTTFMGKWSGYNSDNYKQFLDNYQIIESKAEAARNTWTGKTVEELGFRKITEDDVNVCIEQSRVNALFLR